MRDSNPLHLRWMGVILTLFVLTLTATLVATNWARSYAEAVTDLDARQLARTHLDLLSSELQKYRLLPLVLTEYPNVITALKTGDADAAAQLNPKLEILAERTNAEVIYVLRNDGRTIAASNWRSPTSFVGHDYSYRRYFQQAMHDGAAELYALGTTSGHPGLFIAQRIMDGGRILGVIVVKVEFRDLETTWARQPGYSFVTDRRGVIIITSVPEWRFRMLGSANPALRRRLRGSLQYGSGAARPLNMTIEGRTVRQGGGTNDTLWRMADIRAPVEGGTLHHLSPLGPALSAARARARVLAMGGLVGAMLVLGLWWRAHVRLAAQREMRVYLEHEVALRTTELTSANDRLQEESRERERAACRLREALEELAQANRLSYIGQITASVAHEINQPVAAIRIFAENAQKFLTRGSIKQSQTNLSTIVDLTVRIGAITEQLRGFARRARKGAEPVEVQAAINGALLLTRDRLRSSDVIFECIGCDRPIHVIAGRIQLEQILVNLIQNALDALQDTLEPRLTISVSRRPNEILLLVTDNGTGVPTGLIDELFTPFVTSRSDGLGLGLGLSRDLAREFGGDLILAESGRGSTTFELRLRPA